MLRFMITFWLCIIGFYTDAQPDANFSARRLCVDSAIQIHDTSDGSPTSWSWTFEGGSPATSSLEEPTVSWSSTGTYTVSLTATNAFGSDTKTANLRVVLCQPSKGIYQIPYMPGTLVNINRNHLDHLPDNNELDMAGFSGTGTYFVVAAASGIIRYLDDTNESGPGCNNVMWIEHPNGEWSKYSHMATDSSTDLGWSVGDQVFAGQTIGIESNVGTSTDHLHFEIVVPDDPSDPITGCGFIESATVMIPVICGIPTNYFLDDIAYIAAGPCSANSCAFNITLTTNQINFGETELTISRNLTSNGINQDVRYRNGSNGLFRSQETVILRPGFRADRGSHFRAEIESCTSTTSFKAPDPKK